AQARDNLDFVLFTLGGLRRAFGQHLSGRAATDASHRTGAGNVEYACADVSFSARRLACLGNDGASGFVVASPLAARTWKIEECAASAFDYGHAVVRRAFRFVAAITVADYASWSVVLR